MGINPRAFPVEAPAIRYPPPSDHFPPVISAFTPPGCPRLTQHRRRQSLLRRTIPVRPTRPFLSDSFEPLRNLLAHLLTPPVHPVLPQVAVFARRRKHLTTTSTPVTKFRKSRAPLHF